MAVHIELTYGKKLGLPEYSSHHFCVSMKAEVANLEEVPLEVARAYESLQSAVDRQIVNPGFVPGDDPEPAASDTHGTRWKCSEKQKDLILKIIDENRLDRHDIEHLAQERFGHGVVLLNKIEASGLIEDLLAQIKRNRNSGYYQRAA